MSLSSSQSWIYDVIWLIYKGTSSFRKQNANWKRQGKSPWACLIRQLELALHEAWSLHWIWVCSLHELFMLVPKLVADLLLFKVLFIRTMKLNLIEQSAQSRSLPWILYFDFDQFQSEIWHTIMHFNEKFTYFDSLEIFSGENSLFILYSQVNQFVPVKLYSILYWIKSKFLKWLLPLFLNLICQVRANLHICNNFQFVLYYNLSLGFLSFCLFFFERIIFQIKNFVF